uniref:C2 domain-containing protein n=1 Tax=Pediculus humanus subsp. corporis TaxID=121224 RepID=A0A1S4MWQ2_PEDHC
MVPFSRSIMSKGKVGTGSSPSSSCSTTSGEEEVPKDKALRHRDSRSSGGSNKCRKIAQEVPVEEEITPYQSISLSESNVLNVDENVNGNNNIDEIFDVTDLQSEFEDHENIPISTCGCLEVAFAYDAPMRKMTIHVLQARDIPSKDRGGATHTQVRLLMLPSKKQKHKSKIRSGENPQFMESFLLHRINPEDVNSMGVRFRLYGCERMRRERMIGECVVSFATMNLELETNMWLVLEPRANITLNSSSPDLKSLTRSDSTSSSHSMQHGGVSELLIGLAYNGTTGRLSVEIVKGSHFSLCGAYRNPTMPKISDTYIRLSLISSTGREITRCKTSIRRGQPNPLFKELFMFQVALFQLPDVTLMISVYMKRSMKRKEMVGWFSMGLKSSGEEELSHWNDMRDAKGEQICRWHVLIDS